MSIITKIRDGKKGCVKSVFKNFVKNVNLKFVINALVSQIALIAKLEKIAKTVIKKVSAKLDIAH